MTSCRGFGSCFHKGLSMTILQYALLFGVAVFAFIPGPETELVVVSIMCLYSTIFYYYVTTVMMTIKVIQFDWEGGISEMWQFRFIMGMAMAIIYVQGYIGTFFYVLPFFIIGTVGDIFSSLLILGYISLDNSEDTEE